MHFMNICWTLVRLFGHNPVDMETIEPQCFKIAKLPQNVENTTITALFHENMRLIP